MPKAKVLVTGGAGFIGSHLVDLYLESDYEVVVIDNLATGKNENLNSDAKFYEMDITSPELEDFFKKEKFDFVNHLAAQASARDAIIEPIFDAKTNIIGTINVLKNAARTQVKKVIFSSSVAIYGEQEYHPAAEDHPIHPVNPYGVSKAAAESYVSYYHQHNNLNYTIFRYANVYGPRQDPFGEGGVVAIFVQKILAGEQPLINGDGRQTRDFIYVGDIARANLIATESNVTGTFNLSNIEETSILDLFNLIKNISQSSFDPLFGEIKAGDQRRSLIDSKLARERLNWRPQTDLVEGLKKTVEFFQACK
ncbi:MAG TPA: NAD-dependent epimerase/dehydratase family protein [Actinobacteria bacterium]|nr:NAD-dependent epimerase/dehydratase family protein [Actinomycetes bacterium]HEX21429.1 NAD-dependent epimerase/dehydratase family protein [Actinomycetota bacterium]